MVHFLKWGLARVIGHTNYDGPVVSRLRLTFMYPERQRCRISAIPFGRLQGFVDVIATPEEAVRKHAEKHPPDGLAGSR